MTEGIVCHILYILHYRYTIEKEGNFLTSACTHFCQDFLEAPATPRAMALARWCIQRFWGFGLLFSSECRARNSLKLTIQPCCSLYIWAVRTLSCLVSHSDYKVCGRQFPMHIFILHCKCSELLLSRIHVQCIKMAAQNLTPFAINLDRSYTVKHLITQ